MICPKCNSSMQVVVVDNIAVDRCTTCRGLWFDMLEHEHLAAIESCEEIDVGSSELGECFNRIEDIHCPKCSSPMLRMVDARQPHIWYEGCPTCFGVFFDAGEFRDYREHSVLEFFRDIFTKERF